METNTAAHRARRILIGRMDKSNRTRSDARKTLGAAMAATAALALAACDTHQTVVESYAGSRKTNAVITSYSPAKSGSMVMVGDVAMPTGGSPAGVGMVVKGMGAVEIALPGDCDGVPIRARIGRMITLRQDLWKTPEGGTVGQVTNDEMVAAVCGDFTVRDVAQKRRDAPG